MPGTLLLDDWKSSIEDQLRQHATDALNAAKQAAAPLLAPPTISAPTPQVDPQQVLNELQSHVNQLVSNAQQATQPAVTVLGQQTQNLNDVQDELQRHVQTVLGGTGGTESPVTQLGAQQAPPVIGGVAQQNGVVTTLPGPQQPAAAGDVSGAPSADTTVAPPTRVGQGQSAFITSLQPLAQRVAQRTGIDANVMVAIAANETGWGQSATAKDQNNLFSIQGDGSNGSRWATYKSPEESFQAFTDLISTAPRYKQAWADRADPVKFVNDLRSAGYVVDEPGYPAQGWVDQVNSINAHLPAAPTMAPPHAPSTPVQTDGTQSINTPDADGRIWPLAVKSDNTPTATYHSQGGSDLMAPRGTPVLAMQSGKVQEVFTENGSHQFGGNAVLIHGNDGLDYYYAHFDQPSAVKVGQTVSAGEQIGAVGNTGNAWKGGDGATHLHIGIGHGISDGVGSEGGLGKDFNAQALLASLEGGVGKGTVSPAPSQAAPTTPATAAQAPVVGEPAPLRPTTVVMGQNQPAGGQPQQDRGPIQAAQDQLGSTFEDIKRVGQQAAQRLGDAADQARQTVAPVVGTAAATAADLATGGITRRFNENLQDVGQGVAGAVPDLSRGVAPVLGGAASALHTTAANLPKDAPALAGILDIAASQLEQPGVLDAIQQRQDLNNKYANTPGATTIRDANGQPIVLSVDSSVMTPEDKTKYDQTGFVIGSISGPVEREGGLPPRAAERARQASEPPTPRGVGEEPIRTLPGGGVGRESLPEAPSIAAADRTTQDIYNPAREGGYVQGQTWVMDPDGSFRVKGADERLIDRRDPGANTPYFAVQRRGDGTAYVGEMYVPQPMRNQGIGARMYDQMAKWADQNGYTLVTGSDRSPLATASLASAERQGLIHVEPAGEVGIIRPGAPLERPAATQLPGPPAARAEPTGFRAPEVPAADVRGTSGVPGVGGGTPPPETGFRAPVTPDDLNVRQISQQQARQLVGPAYDPSTRTTGRPPEEGGGTNFSAFFGGGTGKDLGDSLIRKELPDLESRMAELRTKYPNATDEQVNATPLGQQIERYRAEAIRRGIADQSGGLTSPPTEPSGRTTTRPPEEGGEATSRGLSPMAQRFADQYLTPSNAVREFDRAVAEGRATPTAAERAAIDELRTTPDPPERVTPRGELPQRPVPVEPAAPGVVRRTEQAGAAGREPPYTPPVQNLSEVHSNPHLLNEARPGETPMTPDERMTYAEDLESRRQANQDRLDAIDEQLRNPNAKPVRPPWGAGWTNDQLTAIARAHGESAYAPLWWERAGLDVGSGEVRENVGQGGFKNPNAARDATPAELRAERNQLGAEQRDLQAAIGQQTAAPDNASFVRRQQTRGELPFENGAQGVNGPHATEQHNDTPGGVAADMVTRNGTKDYGNPLRDGPGQVIGTAERGGRDVTGRGITDVEAAGIGEPSAKTKFLMPNLDAMLGEEMPEVRAQIQKAAEDNQELMAAYQQGRISHDSVVTDLANRVGMSKKDWLKTKVGQGFSTPELAALQAAAIDAEGQSKKLAADIGARENGVDGLTPEEVAHSLETFVDNAHLLAVARGGRASAGRSLNILKKKLTATLAQGINASNERIAATKAKAQAQAAVKRATKQLEDSKNLDEEKRTVVNGLKNGMLPQAPAAASRPNQAGAPRAPKNIIDQIADAYDQLDRYNALSLHEKADVQAKLDAQRAANAAKRQAATREPPQELLAALKKELQWEQNNFAKRKDTWETMAFWDSKANEKVAMKRNAFRGELYIEQYRKAAELAAKKAESDATRAWDLESRRQSVQSSKASALLESIGGEKPSRELLKNYIEAINNPDPMVAAKFIKGLQDPGWWGKSQILRIAGLLSSTATHAVNTTGNTTQPPLTLAEHALVVPIDAVRAAITGGERQAYRAELLPMAQAYGPGWFSALPRALEILKTGVSPQEAANIAQGKLGRPGFASGSGKFDATIEMPLRALQAEDELFRGGAFAMQSQRVATHYAYGEGFRGKQLVGRANDIIANLESYPELYTQAQKATDRMLFQEKRTMPLSDRIPTKGVPGAIVQGGIGQVLPFIKTPGNITAQGFGLSPFGGAGVLEAVANRRNLRPEQLGQQTLLAEQRLARTALGTMIFGGFTAMGLGAFTAGKSMLTGAYDPDEASTYPQGYREWSQVVEDPVSGNTYYVPFQNFGAAGVPMAMAAIATDAYRHGKDFFSGDEAIRAGTAIGQYMMDNTFLQGLSDTVNVFHDPTRYGPTAVQGLISSYGPYSAMGRQVQRAMGVASRNPREGFHGLLDAMAANYPGTSGTVPEATTALGEPRTQGISGAASFALPFRADISRDEPTLTVLRANDIQIPAAPKSLNVVGGSIELTEEEQDQVKRARGEAIKLGVAAVAKSAAYQRADVGLRNEMLKRELTFDTQRVNNEFLKQFSREQILKRRQEKAVPEPYYLAGADNG